MLKFFRNLLGLDRYASHHQAVIISCFFNPENSPYRLEAFNKFYKTIKHLNHRIIECAIGDAEFQIPETKYITRIRTKNLLWHKESLLNKLIKDLPQEYRYVFWIDADVIFENKNWLVDGVQKLKGKNIIQPFEYCVHLGKGQEEADTDATRFIDNLRYYDHLDYDKNDAKEYEISILKGARPKNVWRSFCSNYAKDRGVACCENYDVHGHVGFAWGARREVLDTIPLYDKALIGGADHVIAHAAAGHIPHKCIRKSFTDDIESVETWSKKFYMAVRGYIGYVPGTLLHIWHGDLQNRQYLKRIQDFTGMSKEINEQDENGLYVTNNLKHQQYVKNYYAKREAKNIIAEEDDGFLQSLAAGYITNSTTMGTIIGGNPLGAMVGDMMNDSENQQKEPFEFGGGAGGGGGAGSHYDLNTDTQAEQSNHSNDTTPIDNSGSENFS